MTTIPFNLDGIDDVDMTPRNTTITDEMVEKLVTTFSQSLRSWDDKPYPELTPRDWNRAGYAALKAVAPMLAAQIMREAAALRRSCGSADELEDAILARAQELDPQ